MELLDVLSSILDVTRSVLYMAILLRHTRMPAPTPQTTSQESVLYVR